MIESYVNCQLAALQEVFPNLSTNDGLSLILAGFGQVQEYDLTTYNQVVNDFHLTTSGIVATNSAYESGK